MQKQKHWANVYARIFLAAFVWRHPSPHAKIAFPRPPLPTIMHCFSEPGMLSPSPSRLCYLRALMGYTSDGKIQEFFVFFEHIKKRCFPFVFLCRVKEESNKRCFRPSQNVEAEACFPDIFFPTFSGKNKPGRNDCQPCLVL